MAYDFNTIARSYDRMNHLMTLGLDRRWRRRAVKEVESGVGKDKKVLDVACGTGDLSLLFAKQGCQVVGVDLSQEMLAIAEQKNNSQFSTLNFQFSNAEQLPFADGEFDTVSCAFGVRNFVHLEKGLAEMLRVLKPQGMMLILELSTPDSPLLRPFYQLYAHRIIPLLGKFFAGNRAAYTYLPASIEQFPKGEAFCRIVESLNATCRQRKLTFGVCRLYIINKSKSTRTATDAHL